MIRTIGFWGVQTIALACMVWGAIEASEYLLGTWWPVPVALFATCAWIATRAIAEAENEATGA